MARDSLIYDRTAADVSRVKSLTKKMIQGTVTEAERAEWLSCRMKGAWNYTDLNRIEEWTDYLAGVLCGYGYTVTIVPGRTWQAADTLTRKDVDRMRSNINALQAGFYSLPDWREILFETTMDVGQTNALEWDLHALYVWLGRMVAVFRYAGEICAGEVW